MQGSAEEERGLCGRRRAAHRSVDRFRAGRAWRGVCLTGGAAAPASCAQVGRHVTDTLLHPIQGRREDASSPTPGRGQPVPEPPARQHPLGRRPVRPAATPGPSHHHRTVVACPRPMATAGKGAPRPACRLESSHLPPHPLPAPAAACRRRRCRHTRPHLPPPHGCEWPCAAERRRGPNGHPQATRARYGYIHPVGRPSRWRRFPRGRPRQLSVNSVLFLPCPLRGALSRPAKIYNGVNTARPPRPYGAGGRGWAWDARDLFRRARASCPARAPRRSTGLPARRRMC